MKHAFDRSWLFLIVPLFTGVGFNVSTAEEIRVRLRERTDPAKQSDIEAALALQRKYLESKPPMGLSELASKPEPIRNGLSQDRNPSPPGPLSPKRGEGESKAFGNGANSSMAVESHPSEPASQTESASSIVIGACPDVVIESGVVTNSVDPEATRRPSMFSDSAAKTSGSVEIKPSFSAAPATSNSPIVYRVRLLPPPRVTDIEDWSPNRAVVAANGANASATRYRPVSAQIGGGDPEATVAPRLNSSVVIGDPAVTQAAFQQAPGGFAAPPGMTAPPPMVNPNANILPNSSTSQVLPSQPMTNVVPNTGAPITPNRTYPTSPIPTYPPNTGSTIMAGEPFVTGPPCQFDASYMVEPTSYMQSSGCGSAGAAPSSGVPYAGIPGNIIPPTVMPNQVPAGLYGNSGFRPLIGLGQDNYNVQLGRGIIGQPVAYVPGQPFRNFLRYLAP